MLSIKSNSMASNAARYLSSSYDNLATSVERLSSGQRINSASDDAAGMAVRESMRADIQVLDQGSRNAEDGVSLLQTMEGAMQTIDDLMVRMEQLAEQSSTGSYVSSQRTIMNNEFQQMAAEITRIAQATSFNGINMLDNSASVTIRFGALSDKIDVAGSDVTASALGLSSVTIANQASAAAALATLSSAINTKDTARAKFGYSINRLESTKEVLGVQSENLEEAESRISDVDVAEEMATMTRTQVLAEAGAAMLAQANTIPQMALTLLR